MACAERSSAVPAWWASVGGRHRCAAVFALLFVAACAHVGRDVAPPSEGRAGERACYALLARVDTAVARAGVRDAEAAPIAGYPYLRADRLAASFLGQADGGGTAFGAVVAHMRQLDRDARRVELANLPGAAAVLSEAAGTSVPAGQSAAHAMERCADRLAALDATEPAARALLRARVRVPDDYVEWERGVGLYALSRLAFAAGIERWHGESVAAFAAARRTAPESSATRYVPQARAGASRAEVTRWLSAEARDPMGKLRLGPAELERLFERYAPVYVVAGNADFDRIGAVRWEDANTPGIDAGHPVVYRRVAYTRYRGATLVQLVYTAWYAERPRRSRLDALGGRLDGTVYRVTLGPRGDVLIADAIHPCGCWHLFFPAIGAVPVPAPNRLEEWAFSPAPFPALQEGQRVALSIESGTHALIGLWSEAPGPETAYRTLEEDALRSLDLPGGGRRSLYGPDGLVAATRRPERLLFWPMGVPSAGTMRQWGHHATAFIGRRHFDAPDLLERRFRFDEALLTAGKTD